MQQLNSPQPSAIQMAAAWFRSEKVHRSKNIIDEDISTSMNNKENIICLDLQTHNNKAPSVNSTMIQVFSNRVDMNNEYQQINSNSCCFCHGPINLIQICHCSYAHIDCANNHLSQGRLDMQATCSICQEMRQVQGVVRVDWSKWREFKCSLVIEFSWLIFLMGTLGFVTWLSIQELGPDLQQSKIMVTILVFTYTFGFILMVCLVNRMVGHLRRVDFVIQRYNPQRSALNREYIQLLIKA